MPYQSLRFNGKYYYTRGKFTYNFTHNIFHRFKNGKEVTADARLKIFRDTKRSESYWMSLTVVKEQDAGEYEVRATNVLGSAESISIVTVISEYLGNHSVGQLFLKSAIISSFLIIVE